LGIVYVQWLQVCCGNESQVKRFVFRPIQFVFLSGCGEDIFLFLFDWRSVLRWRRSVRWWKGCLQRGLVPVGFYL